MIESPVWVSRVVGFWSLALKIDENEDKRKESFFTQECITFSAGGRPTAKTKPKCPEENEITFFKLKIIPANFSSVTKTFQHFIV